MSKNTIKVKSYLNIQDEKIAGGAITPGHLVKRTSTDTVVVHATALGNAQRLFALEDENQGRGIGDAYAATGNYTHVKLWLAVPGEVVNAFAKDALAIGDYVESGGDGTLQKFTSGVVLGACIEAQATPGGRVLIEIV